MNMFANAPRISGRRLSRVSCGPTSIPSIPRLARFDQGAGGRLGAGHRWALLSAADARHVDRRLCLPGLAHHRNAGGQLSRHAAGLDRRRRRGHDADRCADALRLDHRPHQDRRAAGLRRRSQDSGWLQGHAAVATGARRPRRSRSRSIRQST